MEAMNRRVFLAASVLGDWSVLSFGREAADRLLSGVRGRKERAHLFISGKVQGVSYRASTQDQARRLGVAGWVRNLPDGRVEAVLQGPRGKVDELIRWCRQGPPAAKVEKVDVAWEPAGEDLQGFDVRS
jgi:acylphosphatase